MNFKIKKVVMESLLSKAASVLSSGDVLPILKNFNVELLEGNLMVMATDLELSVIAQTPLVESVEDGRAVFPGKKLLDIVKEAEDGVIDFAVNGEQAVITCMGTTWTIQLMKAADYPALPQVEDAEPIQVSRVSLVQAVSIVKGAAAKESIRPALQMISIVEGKVRASDGAVFRQVTVGELQQLDTQIPIGAVDDLLRLLRNTELERISIGQTEDHLLFSIGADVFIITKTNVAYPDIETALLGVARKNTYRLTVDRQQFIAGIKRVRVTADEETRGLLLLLSANKLQLRAKDKYGNFATQELDCFWEGGEKALGVNHEHALDMLSVLPSPSINIMLGDDVKTRKAPIFIEDGIVTAVLQQLSIQLS